MYPAKSQAGRDVSQHGFPGKQGVLLEHVARAPVEPIQALAEHEHGAFTRRDQAGGEVEQSRFSAAAGADNRDESSGADFEVDPLDRRICGKAFGDVIEANCRGFRAVQTTSVYRKPLVPGQ